MNGFRKLVRTCLLSPFLLGLMAAEPAVAQVANRVPRRLTPGETGHARYRSARRGGQRVRQRVYPAFTYHQDGRLLHGR